MPASAPPRPDLLVCRLGRAEYRQAARLQRSLRAAREARAMSDVLLLVEHEPVITCGTRTTEAEVADAATREIPLVPVERGGKATWHGPGQVVAYPIFDVAVVRGDVPELVRRLEAAIIAVLATHGVVGTGRNGLPGVWIDAAADRPRKVASLGLRLTRGVTFHGVAINVACDLTPFSWFTACGIPDAETTSIARELGTPAIHGSATADMLVHGVETQLVEEIAQRFERRVVDVEPGVLRDLADRYPVPDPPLSLPGAPRHRAVAAASARVGAHA